MLYLVDAIHSVHVRTEFPARTPSLRSCLHFLYSIFGIVRPSVKVGLRWYDRLVETKDSTGEGTFKDAFLLLQSEVVLLAGVLLAAWRT